MYSNRFFTRLWIILVTMALMGAVAQPIAAQPPLPPEKPSPSSLSPPPQDSEVDYAPGEILVKFKLGIAGLSAQSTLHAEGLQTLEVSPYSGVMRVKVAPGNESQAIAALQGRKDVEYVTFNYRIQALGDPNDPGFSSQWNLHNTGQTGGTPGADIDAAEAWDIYTGGSNVTIAIIDTGVDLDHPDLQAKIVPGYDFVNSDNVPDDDNGHGTHVAGIAAATGNNGVGVAGVSWGARIMPLKALDARGSGYLYDLSQAIYYAADHGAKVISMSLGGSCATGWPNVEDAINYAVSRGVLPVAASGNNGSSTLSCPAAIGGVMAVGATTHTDVWAPYSNYGSGLAVVAPGGYYDAPIYSTIPGSYGSMFGTSMATPHVSGLAALIWSFNPSLSQVEVRNTIQSTADDLGAPGWDDYFGYGRINARRALESLVSLQILPAQISFLIDDDSGPFPASAPVGVTTTSIDSITWNATISPAVSWLRLVPPTFGTVSASSSSSFVLEVTGRPDTYGIHTTNVIVTGTLPSGGTIGPVSTQVRITYVHDLHQYRFPLILKNASANTR